MRKCAFILLALALVSLLEGCSLFSQKPIEFKLYQNEEQITEISRVFVTEDEALSQSSIDVKETVSGEQLVTAIGALRETPCKEPAFEPRDTPYGACFMIKYADGSFQLLSECRNDYFDKEYHSQGYQSLEFDVEEFNSLWNKGFGD